MRQSIIHQLDSTAEAARTAALRADSNLATAVHEARKSLRRVRAIADLVAGVLPRRDQKRILRALRGARKKLGVARDTTVAPNVLAWLMLETTELEDLRTAIEAAVATAPSTADVRSAVDESAACVVTQVEALRLLLPETLEWSTLVDGARAVYRQARDARKSAKNNRRAFHTWRRRTKELSYQLEALAAIDPDRVAEVHQEIEEASDAQGPIVDVIMVRDLVRGDRHLRETLDSQLVPMMKGTRRASKAVFRTKARAFGKRLARSDKKAGD